ncbi:MAG: SH3 domain-containing protein, partial [Proteobacteria bacterium]|nr:SH3 domain-containing protein [Pseudomonadota bacterium]
MKKFILLTFVFLGWAFYEESGGADFVPRKAELMAAAAEARAAAQAERALTEAAKPATPPIVVPVEMALAVKEVTVTPRSDPAPAATPAATDSPPEITLVSLEQSSVLFARPLQQVGDQGADPAVPGVLLQPRQADMRMVTGNRVNMRSGPGTNFGVMGSLVRGDEVEVISDDGAGWVKLRTRDGR